MNTSFYSLFESLLEATFEILKRILCTLKWNSAKSIVPSFSNFFFIYIVLWKWIYSCFSKLVQNKIFWKKIIKLYPHQLKTHRGFCTDGTQFLPLRPFPGVKALSYHPFVWQAEPCSQHVSSNTSQLRPKSFRQYVHVVRVSHIHSATSYWQLKKYFPQTFEGIFWGKCLFVPDAEGSTL